ncbi:hypothetical protein NE237_007788 [Protea cynaroides]|uniref:Peroxisomal membrane protein PEX14 n=1 Tax=Protea cynaroides TaxID=273540 RepID=A0A9Q0KQ54_9MAGN|nr:hypothetical protein NE237_007788 [Protea cynaroides]
MGSESTTSPNVSDEKHQNPGSDLVKPMDGNGQDAKEGTLKETPSKSVFINSEPMREEQVQNAIKFLSHPKVQGSPVIYRRSFLEKKGLTKEEIDEAFRRVPDPTPTVTSVQPATEKQDGQLKSSANMQTQGPTQTSQPAAAAPPGVVSTVATWSNSQFHWSHACLAVGLLAASGAGSALFFKHAVVPRLKSWIRKVVFEEEEVDFGKKNNSKPSLAEEAAAAAKAAAAAAADVAKASQEMLNSKSEEKKYFEAFRSLFDVQIEEMKSMSNAIRELEATRDIALSSNKQREEHTQTVSRNVRPSSAPVSMETSVAPYPKSYMEMMAMVQRGEKPLGIRDINDLPPNPNKPPSNPQLTPTAELSPEQPWEVSLAQNNSSYVLQPHGNGEGSRFEEQDSRSASQLNGYSSEPWRQGRNARITEIESEDELKTTSNGAVRVANQQVPQRVWVSPQPPPVAMPEAAAAIRQPKPLTPNKQTSNDQIRARPSYDIDKLQRVTEVSESGGPLEINNESPSLESNELQEQEISADGNILPILTKFGNFPKLNSSCTQRTEINYEPERERRTRELQWKPKKAVSDDRFRLSFYYRIADQLVDQAKVYRDEQRINDLYTTLSRYCRLAEVLPQQKSYMTYSSKEKLHHNKIYQDFIQELEMLKPVVGHDSWSQQNSLSSITDRKVARCCTVGTKNLSYIRVYEEKTGLASVCTVDTTTTKDRNINLHKVTQSSPSPSLSCVHKMPYAGHVSHLTVEDSKDGDSNCSSNETTSESRILQDVHISARLMEDFLELARDNTDKDLETCGILGAFLKKGTFYVTTLIVPKQESTSSSCQALNEEEIYTVQNEQSLFPIGWIHTHPSQTCFMSSIDLHTHYSYQVMLPEAFAIVMAPTDTSRSYGIFRLTDPSGISVLKDCQERGFHSHQEPPDGSPLYEHCSNVYINQNLRFEIFDLR